MVTEGRGYINNPVSVIQTANYVVHAEDLPHAVPGRTIVYCLKTMARCATSARTLQSYQSGVWLTKQCFQSYLVQRFNTG